MSDNAKEKTAEPVTETPVISHAEVPILAQGGKDAEVLAIVRILAEERARFVQATEAMDARMLASRTQIESLSQELEECKRKASDSGDNSLATFLTSENTRLTDETEATRLALTEQQAQCQALRTELTRVQEQSEEVVMQLNTMRGQLQQISARVKKAESDLDERTQEADTFKALLESEKIDHQTDLADLRSQSAAKEKEEPIRSNWLPCC